MPDTTHPALSPAGAEVDGLGLTRYERDALHDLMIHADPFSPRGEGFLLADTEAYALSRILRRDDLRQQGPTVLPVSHLRWV